MENTVELLGYYGGDETHALSAWVSTNRNLTDEKRNRLGKFLAELAQFEHYSPYEKSFLHFLVVADTASHIHLLKHRIGVSLNGESARYKELKEDKWYIPDDWPEATQEAAAGVMAQAYKAYHAMVADLTPTLGRKRAKESSRFLLPYSNQLTLDVGFNFKSFMHFQKLRNSPDAQREIREIAQKMLDLVKATNSFDKSLAAFGYA